MRKHSLRRSVIFALLAALLTVPLHFGAFPAHAAVPASAYDFYVKYGANRMVIDGEDFYFCTRGKRASVGSTTKYLTLGYHICLRTAKGSYETEAVIGESIRLCSGSAKVEGGTEYLYDLFKFDGDTLYKRLRMAYPEENFLELYRENQNNTLLMDAIMTIVKRDVPQGACWETEDGMTQTSGKIYLTEEAIRGAAAWGRGNDFSSEFNILVSLVMAGSYPPVLIRHIALPYLPLLPEGSIWQSSRLYAPLERSLARPEDDPLAEWNVDTSDWNRFLQQQRAGLSLGELDRLAADAFLGG